MIDSRVCWLINSQAHRLTYMLIGSWAHRRKGSLARKLMDLKVYWLIGLHVHSLKGITTWLLIDHYIHGFVAQIVGLKPTSL